MASMSEGSEMPRDPGGRVRDVADFQSRWAEFRPLAQEALRQPALRLDLAETLDWMIEVMDRIAPRDVEDHPPQG